MLMVRLVAAVALALFVSGTGCGNKQQKEPASATNDSATQAAPVSEERAVELAKQLGAQEGYDLDEYVLKSVERTEDGNGWWVHFEHKPPTPPGGHFSVKVQAAGEARLHHGE